MADTATMGRLLQPTLGSAIVQRSGDGDVSTDKVHEAARRGIRTPSTAMPYTGDIQRAFGHHDISGIRFHSGPKAVQSARDMSAEAYSTAGHVVSSGSISKHTAAHEAAHYIQQQGGVRLKSNVGVVGDQYERHADAVADAVVQGRSAEALLDRTVSPMSQSALKSDNGGLTAADLTVQMQRPEEDDKHEGLTTIAQTVGGPGSVAYAGNVYVRSFMGGSPAMMVRGRWSARLARMYNVDEGDILVSPKALEKLTETAAISRGVLAHEIAHLVLDVTDHPLALYQHEMDAARNGSDETLKGYLNAMVGTISNLEIMKSQIEKTDESALFIKGMEAIAEG